MRSKAKQGGAIRSNNQIEQCKDGLTNRKCKKGSRFKPKLSNAKAG